MQVQVLSPAPIKQGTPCGCPALLVVEDGLGLIKMRQSGGLFLGGGGESPLTIRVCKAGRCRYTNGLTRFVTAFDIHRRGGVSPPGAAAPLAPPLGELSAKLTERASGAGYPLRRLIAASSPKGRAKGLYAVRGRAAQGSDLSDAVRNELPPRALRGQKMPSGIPGGHYAWKRLSNFPDGLQNRTGDGCTRGRPQGQRCPLPDDRSCGTPT